MRNKRAATLLALLLAGSMVLSGPSAALASASSGDSKESGKTEEKESESADTAKGKKTKAKKAKKIEKDLSGNSTSSNKVSSSSLSVSTVSDPSDEGSKEEKEEREESLSQDDISGDTGSFKVDVGISENAYTYDATDGEKLTVRKDRALTIGGTVSDGSILVDSAGGADLTFEDLYIAKSPALQVASGSGAVKLHLAGQKNILASIRVDNDKQITIDGEGILQAEGGIQCSPYSKVVVKGGNIQTEFSGIRPQNEKGEDLYSVLIQGLRANEDHTLNDVKVASAPYTLYGSVIRSDEKGRIFMYLPEGEVQLRLKDKFGDVDLEGVVSGNGSQLQKVVSTTTPTPSSTPLPTPSSTPKPTSLPSSIPTDTPRPSPSITPTDIPDQQAQPAENGLYWINEGATYRSGATLQFYATGAGYGPTEPQELHPVRRATRYVPVNWNVVTSGGTRVASGSWRKRDKVVTSGTTSTSGNGYTPGEYQFKDAFTLSTNQYTSVPYALQVNYQREIYTGRKWKPQREVTTRSVNFYIRNVATVTPTRYPYTTPYRTAGVTTTAARSSISSNAKNASTMDNTPVGALVVLMLTAAGSGAAIFRKKRDRS